ncbi:MAG: glycosyltransferase family 2 protein [Infirmifilum sp.]
MKISVAITTYKRAWALRYSLESLLQQSRTPDEVVIVLKPSGDGSEEVIRRYYDRLPIHVIEQEKGNFTDAVSMAIRHSNGDVILFMDDDAIAEKDWVMKYEKTFQQQDVGGASGLTYIARLENGKVIRTNEMFYSLIPTKEVFYRRPLPQFSDYCGWVSISGFMGLKDCPGPIIKSALLDGVNMGLRKELVADCPLDTLFKKSKRGLWNEKILATCIRKKGYNIYSLREPSLAPIVWHIHHVHSLTRRKGFWQEFWIHYDRVANFWRLKKLGVEVSYTAYLAALIVALRRRPIQRLLATIYGLVVRA